jgi:ribose/xylose/arabinose/galactoside ABC-type transport system permease subunit
LRLIIASLWQYDVYEVINVLDNIVLDQYNSKWIVGFCVSKCQYLNVVVLCKVFLYSLVQAAPFVLLFSECNLSFGSIVSIANALIASDDVHNGGVRPRNRDKVHICIVLLLFLLVLFCY